MSSARTASPPRRSAVGDLAVAGSTWLSEAGPIDAHVVGGGHLAAALTAAGLPWTPGRGTATRGVETWGIAPDEVLLVVPDPGSPADAAGPPIAALRAAGALVTEVGAGLTHLRLAGPIVGSVLESTCAVDLSARAVPEGAVVNAMVAGVRVTLVRADADGTLGYRLLVPRELAAYLWQVLVDTAASIGDAR
jgi:heterotetrameric sarcosine oxidase gamma subunit